MAATLGCGRGDDGRSILVIGENARVHGKVKAAHVIIHGDVDGPVFAEELLELLPEMHRGAMVEGDPRPLKSVEMPSLKLASSNDA